MTRIEINPFEFATWMRSRGLFQARLAEAMEIGPDVLTSLLTRQRNWRGGEWRFTPDMVRRMNEALLKLASKLLNARTYFDVTKAVVKRSKLYDPSCIERFRSGVFVYLNMKVAGPMVFGWSVSKVRNTFTDHCSKVYGNILRGDVQAMNDYLDSLAEELVSFTIVMPDYKEGTNIPKTRVRTTLSDEEFQKWWDEYSHDVQACFESGELSADDFLTKWKGNLVIRELNFTYQGIMRDDIAKAKKIVAQQSHSK